ncbi:MAG: protein kinase [Lentisphaerae bacterium]|jgi:serine/threonine protein kinase|nr:protein kinase [Lentisphaerota bacterium]
MSLFHKKSDDANRPADPKPTFGPGDSIGQYTVVRCVGIGGMGEVYQAKHAILGNVCAVKFLKEEIAKNFPDLVKQFIQEAKISSAINHPNLIGVTNAYYDPTQNLAFIVMEYVDGCSLAKIIAKRPLSVIETFNVALNITRALKAISAQKVTHRDIKPENILMANNGDVKLADLGIAKVVKANENRWNTYNTKRNIASPPYAAPEQLEVPDKSDFRSDIYALGSTLYRAITGVEPFASDNLAELINLVKYAEPTPITQLLPKLNPEYAAVIHWMMMKDPQERPQSHDDLIELFDAIIRCEAGRSSQNQKALNALLKKHKLISAPPVNWSGMKTFFGKTIKYLLILAILAGIVFAGYKTLPKYLEKQPEQQAEQLPEQQPEQQSQETTEAQPEQKEEPVPEKSAVTDVEAIHKKRFFDAIKEGNPAKTLDAYIFLEPEPTLTLEDGTPLTIVAAKANNLNTLKFLADKKFDLYAKDKLGNSTLTYAVIGATDDDMADFILDYSVNVEHNQSLTQPNNQGNTPLHYAAENTNFNLVDTILQYLDFNLETKNADGLTTLEIAVKHDNLKAVETLVHQKIKPIVTQKALELAKTKEMTDLLKSTQAN